MKQTFVSDTEKIYLSTIPEDSQDFQDCHNYKRTSSLLFNWREAQVCLRRSLVEKDSLFEKDKFG